MTRCSVLVDQALVDGLVDQRNRRIQKLAAEFFVPCRQRRPEALDLRAELAPVTAIDLVAFSILSNAFFC